MFLLEQRTLGLRCGKHWVVASKDSRSCRVEMALDVVVQVGINSRDSGGEILISLVRACQLTRTKLFCPYFE